MRLILVLNSVLLLVLSCGLPDSEIEQVVDNSQTSPGIENYVLPVADTCLYISDSIGTDMSDSNYVFGAVSSVTLTTDGNIAVLDMQKTVISLFTQDGVFIRYIGMQGSGPGEFLYPAAIASKPEGGFVVSDLMGNKLINYGSDYESYIYCTDCSVCMEVAQTGSMSRFHFFATQSKGSNNSGT